MSSASSYDTKQRVREAIDIVDLVGGYLQLRREGRGYKAICPWHQDTRPSLQVNPERQSFKCWVCDIGGDVFSFVMKIEGVTFPEALAMLADRAGIALEKASRSGGQASDEKRVLYQGMAWAVERFHRCLVEAPEAQPARKYLEDRGINAASLARFQIGFAPDEWTWTEQAAQSTPFNTAVLERIGLLARRRNGPGYYDRFKGRLLFPIFDPQGRAVGLGGRVLPGAAEAAKYINSPDTPLFSKSNLLYGLSAARDAIRKTGTALVMEGYTDCVVAHQYGFENAVAVLGTALGAAQIRLLKRFAERVRVVLVLDGDEAGRKRANEVLELFVAENADLRVLTLPDELDPCEFLLERGADAFRQVVDTSVDALTHAERSATAGIDLDRDVHQTAAALEQLLNTIAKAPRLRDDTMTEDRLREEKILGRLSVDFGLAEEGLRERVRELRRKASAGPARTSSAAPVASIQKIEPLEQELLELLLAEPNILGALAESVKVSELASPRCQQVYARAQELSQNGVVSDFHRLLLEFDDPEVKNLLVELDEGTRRKPLGEIDNRLRDVLAGFARRRNEQQVRAQTAVLKGRQLSSDEELAILRKIEQQVKSRQGISEPTDG